MLWAHGDSRPETRSRRRVPKAGKCYKIVTKGSLSIAEFGLRNSEWLVFGEFEIRNEEFEMAFIGKFEMGMDGPVFISEGMGILFSLCIPRSIPYILQHASDPYIKRTDYYSGGVEAASEHPGG